jgi:RimJ/RimL family protein N-acetyltransferase
MAFFDTNDINELLIDNLGFSFDLLSEEYAQNILDENKGNVLEFFFPFEDIGKVNEWIHEQEVLFNKGEKIELAMLSEDKSDFVGLLSIREVNEKLEVGLWIAESQQNKGYAYKGLKAIIDWLKQYSKINTLEYEAEKKNIASNKLAKKLGFDFEKEFIDEGIVYVLYALKL